MKSQKQYQELQTVRRVGKLKAIGSMFCNGMSNQYQTQVPQILAGILTEKEQGKFSVYMDQLNFKTTQYWPCCFAYWCGWLCIPCTAGLSLFLPRLCVSEAENVLRRQIAKINRDILGPKKVEMRLVKQCCSSHLMIQQLDFSQFDGSEINL